MAEHPMQPVERAPDGAIHFKRNAIVRFLVDWAAERGMTLNELVVMDFPDADFEQLAQLLGYRMGAFADLSYVSDEARRKAAQMRAELEAREGKE